MVVDRYYRNEECIAQQFEVIFHKRFLVTGLYYLFRVPSVLVSGNFEKRGRFQLSLKAEFIWSPLLAIILYTEFITWYLGRGGGATSP